MICPNCQLQQPDHVPFCARCHYPFRSRSQGFFTKTSQGYSRADAYAAMQRGGYPAQSPPVPPPQNVPGYPQQTQNPYYVPPQASYQNVNQNVNQNANQNSVRMMYDAAGNPVYVQIMYDAAGNPFYVQMIPKIVGQDAHGNPIYTMVQANTPPIPVQRPPAQMPAQKPYQNPFQNLAQNAMQDSESASESQSPAPRTTAPASPFQVSAQQEVPPVPVLPSPDEMPPEPEHPVPDRPAMRATAIAYAMYAANQEQPDAQNSTGSYFSRTRQNQNQNQNSDPTQKLYEMPLSAEELLKEEAETAFVQEIPDEKTLLRQVFERQAGYYQENPEESKIGTIRIVVSSEEITSVSQRSLYQTGKKPPRAQIVTATPIAENSEKNPEKNPGKSENGNRLFGGKKSKEAREPRKKPVIVDADAFFGDSKGRSVEMLGVRVDGTDEDVQRKLKEMRYGGKKSVRSMEAADKNLDLHAMIEDPQTSDAARRALEGEEVKKVYDSLESAEIAKALEQLNQGIFPKKF